MANEAMSAFVRFFLKDEVSSDAKKVEIAARGAADGMDEAASKAKNDLRSALGQAADACGTCAKGLAAVGAACGAAFGALVGLSSGTEETAENLGRLDASFEAAGSSIEQGRKAYADFYGLVGDGDQAAEAAQNLARLTNSQEELALWTDIGAGAFATFGDALPIENLTETAMETAATGQVVGSMADALNWSTASAEDWASAMGGNKDAQDAWTAAIEEGATKEDAFNAALAACSNEQERATLITETLNGVYGETGQKYLENNEALIDSRQSQAEWNNTLAEAGDAVRPLITAITELGAEIVEKVMPYLQQFADWFKNELPGLKETASAAISWLGDNFSTLATFVGAAVGAFVAFKTALLVQSAIQAVISVMNFLKAATVGQTLAQAALNLVMMANPFVLIATLIGIVVGALVALWMTNEDFRNAVIVAWEAVKGAASAVFGWIGDFISGIWSGINSGVSGVKNGIVSAFNSVKSTVTGIWNGIKSSITNAINGAKNAVYNAINAIKGLFNFRVSLPHISLPHFSISPSGWQIGDLLRGSIPRLGISWYAKGGVFDSPTLIPTVSGFAGVGEAGAEAVAPIDVLMDYVRKAVAEAGGGGTVNNWSITTGETSEEKLARMIAREQKRLAFDLR